MRRSFGVCSRAFLRLRCSAPPRRAHLVACGHHVQRSGPGLRQSDAAPLRTRCAAMPCDTLSQALLSSGASQLERTPRRARTEVAHAHRVSPRRRRRQRFGRALRAEDAAAYATMVPSHEKRKRLVAVVAHRAAGVQRRQTRAPAESCWRAPAVTEPEVPRRRLLLAPEQRATEGACPVLRHGCRRQCRKRCGLQTVMVAQGAQAPPRG